MDTILDMEATDFSILEEWGIGEEGLNEKDKFLFRGASLEELLAKSSRYRQEWLACVQAARYPGGSVSGIDGSVSDDSLFRS